MSDIRPGDYVSTPEGNGTVIVVSQLGDEAPWVDVLLESGERWRNSAYVLVLLHCRACGHRKWEHDAGRCRRSMAQDHGHNTDSICSCRVFAKTIEEVLQAT